ncbi:hypothetical protein PVAG01_10660 [Phlyctema vagabunda]|uniref:Armadillo repeat-containing protein 8 n=1 Tax=Phlyctema vagabunda TaxID=108571 RepID=A0ABR4P2U8_9HELO
MAMARQPWLIQLQNARNSAEQVAALKALKNEIIGHPPKKAVVVNMGILDPIVRMSTNRSSARQDEKSHDHNQASRALSEDEVVRLQALHVVASIAVGGPSYIAPLHASSAVPALLSNLCPTTNPPQIVLAALRALSNYTDSAARAPVPNPSTIASLADALFGRQYVGSLVRILSQNSIVPVVQSQISLAASLIGRVCWEERHRQTLASLGVLNALATKLASFVAADGLVIPGAEVLAQREGLGEFFPDPAPDNVSFSDILEAIAAIIVDSKFRASQLLLAPSMLAIFPHLPSPELAASQVRKAEWTAFNVAGLNARQIPLNVIDFLLPTVPLHAIKSGSAQASAFPPLGTTGSRENLAQNGHAGSSKMATGSLPNWTSEYHGSDSTAWISEENAAIDVEESESPLVSYLIFSLRHRTGMERLMAASVLTVLYRVGLTSKSRDMAIGLLVIPVLVQMLDDEPAKEELRKDSSIAERAPAILAMLITDSEHLQSAAYDAGVIGKLAKMIKVSYNPVPENSLPRPWLPNNGSSDEDLEGAYYARLEEDGQSPILHHYIKVRESTLKAIAALVPFKDEYRKAIVDQGVIPYIVESMSATPGKPTPKIVDKNEMLAVLSPAELEANKKSYGLNPTNVLVAACGATRALSRSVSILRTTLIDNGVAMPVFKLLRHPEIEVQIAATAAVCNLVTDMSPMREVIAEAGVLKILCECARSMNAKLRLNAVWALKHFVQGVNNEMKRLCLDELGQGWLVQLICDDTEDEALLSSKGKSDKAAIIDDAMDEDVEMDQFEDDGDSTFAGRSTSRPSSSRSKSFQRAELRLAALRDAETNSAKKARNDDIAVQEQGLDFIRNLIGGAGQGGTNETTEMIDFLFNALGQDRVFEILASKLRSKVINPFNRRGSSFETRVVPPQSEIIAAVAYILVHMAASVPRHRQIVISQTDLLKLLVPQFNHTSTEVRSALCWLVTNLTWIEDGTDGNACRQRAEELKKLGFLSKLEMLENDVELNVRERAKTALWQMRQGSRP